MDCLCHVHLVTSVTMKQTIDAAKHRIIVLRISFVVSSAVNDSMLL